MPIPAGLALAGKLLTYGSTGLLVDDLTGKNLQGLLMGTPEAQRNYKVDADGNFQKQVPQNTEVKPQERSVLERFLFGTPEAQRSYTVDAAGNYQAGSPVMYGTLPASARVVTDYPEGIPTGVGGGNAGQAQSLDPNAPGGGYIAPTPAPATQPLVTQLSPQDRAYAKERARVEAMIKANPDMQKQDIAAARAKVRDQGMVEFAKANPELAKRVKPGQVGYEVIRDTLYPMPTSLADPTIPDLGYNIDLKFDPSIGRTVSSADVTHSVVDKTTKLPPSAEQTYMDPGFYQLQGYQQGQGAAASQTEGPKIAKLGSAIRRELYPQFDNQTSMSYQMREMFPDRSTQSLENTIKEKGVQLPGSMINIDAQNELVSGATDNFIYQYDAQSREVDKLLRMLAENRSGM